MRLIKVYGIEEISKLVNDRFAVIERKINKTISSEVKKMKEEIENGLIPLKVKLNDMDTIVRK